MCVRDRDGETEREGKGERSLNVQYRHGKRLHLEAATTEGKSYNERERESM